MIEEVKNEVYKLLEKDNTGHGIDHIERVLTLSLKFAESENANKVVTSLIALLHDVDDHKLFGEENAENLTNARIIMNKTNIPENIKNEVLSSLKCIGYSKLLKGLRPVSLEGKIVSDADMCDALGANGILRTYAYNIKNNKPFFDKNSLPIEHVTAEVYSSKCSVSSVNHMFEKILKLKNLMLTESGKKEAIKRHNIVVEFLYQLFYEENVPTWTEYLTLYLKRN